MYSFMYRKALPMALSGGRPEDPVEAPLSKRSIPPTVAPLTRTSKLKSDFRRKSSLLLRCEGAEIKTGQKDVPCQWNTQSGTRQKKKKSFREQRKGKIPSLGIVNTSRRTYHLEQVGVLGAREKLHDAPLVQRVHEAIGSGALVDIRIQEGQGQWG